MTEGDWWKLVGEIHKNIKVLSSPGGVVLYDSEIVLPFADWFYDRGKVLEAECLREVIKLGIIPFGWPSKNQVWWWQQYESHPQTNFLNNVRKELFYNLTGKLEGASCKYKDTSAALKDLCHAYSLVGGPIRL